MKVTKTGLNKVACSDISKKDIIYYDAKGSGLVSTSETSNGITFLN